MKVDEAKQVLDWLASYREAQGTDTALRPADFGQWLQQQEPGAEAPPPAADGLISMHLGFMANYAAFYARRLFRETAIYSMTDWAFLATLLQMGPMSKTELIQHNILEKSSGTEVLKRLQKQGFIEEARHPEDGRIRIVRLTAKGKSTVEAANERIQPMGQLVTGDLSAADKQQLLRLLQRLHQFHQPIFREKKEAEIARLLGLPEGESPA